MVYNTKNFLREIDKKAKYEASFKKFLWKRIRRLWFMWLLILAFEFYLILNMFWNTSNWKTSFNSIICSFLGLGTGISNDSSWNILWPVYASGISGHLMIGLVIYVIVQSISPSFRIKKTNPLITAC